MFLYLGNKTSVTYNFATAAFKKLSRLLPQCGYCHDYRFLLHLVSIISLLLLPLLLLKGCCSWCHCRNGQRTGCMLCPFLPCRACNVCMTYETKKNLPFFYKERKRTQRSFHSFIKNGKERKDRNILL